MSSRSPFRRRLSVLRFRATVWPAKFKRTRTVCCSRSSTHERCWRTGRSTIQSRDLQDFRRVFGCVACHRVMRAPATRLRRKIRLGVNDADSTVLHGNRGARGYGRTAGGGTGRSTARWGYFRKPASGDAPHIIWRSARWIRTGALVNEGGAAMPSRTAAIH